MAGEVKAIEYRDPPEGFDTVAAESRARFARELRDNPDKWGVIAVYSGNKEAADGYKGIINREGLDFWKSDEDGKYEATVAPVIEEEAEYDGPPRYELFVRFVSKRTQAQRRRR